MIQGVDSWNGLPWDSKLTESQREWVEKIDQTASASTRKRNKFTPKQATIIQDLYRKQFQAEKD